jgi:hypothetical protein
MRFIFCWIFFSCGLQATAQFAMPYEDSRKYFYVFANGAPHQLESMAVLQYKAAGNTVVYIDNANVMRSYYNGEKQKTGEGLNALLGASGNMLWYTRDNALNIFEKGLPVTLSFFLSDYKAGDNIIAFKDSRIDLLKVYYEGNIYELEYTLVSKLGNYEVGDNTVAFINGSHYFKVFSQGETLELSTWEPKEFKCGKDMVAFVDGSSNELKLFVTDKIVKLENFQPLSMQMGDNIFAYVSDDNAFKIYTKGKLLKVESYAPDTYMVKDNIAAFYAENKFQVFYDGERYELESVQPRSIIISNNSMAYLDHAGRLKLFSEGKTQLVTTETTQGFELNGDVLKYFDSGNGQRIFYKGKTYAN